MSNIKMLNKNKSLPYLKSSFRAPKSKNKITPRGKSYKTKTTKLPKSPSAFYLRLNRSRLPTHESECKKKRKDRKIVKMLKMKLEENILGEKEIFNALKNSEIMKNKMQILDIAVRHKQELKDKKKMMKNSFTFQKHIFLIIKFINCLKTAVKKKRKEKQLAYQEGILPVMRTADKRKQYSEMQDAFTFQNLKNVHKGDPSTKSKPNVPRKDDKKLSYALTEHKSLFEINKNAYTLDLAPKDSIIEEVEIPLPMSKRINSPTFRKTKSHFRKLRIQNQNKKKIQISIMKMSKLQLRSEKLKRKTDFLVMKNKKRNKKMDKVKVIRRKKRRMTDRDEEQRRNMQVLAGLMIEEEGEDDELDGKVQKTFFSSLNKLKRLHDLAKKRHKEYVRASTNQSRSSTPKKLGCTS